MVASGNGNGYAQIGYEYTTAGSNNSYYFYAYRQNSSVNETFAKLSGQPAVGSAHLFSVYRQSLGYLNLAIDSVDQIATPFELENAGWTTSQAQWSEEVKDLGADIFGTTSDKTDWTNTQYKDMANNWNSSYDGTINNACWYNTNVITAGSSFQAWTSPLNHVC